MARLVSILEFKSNIKVFITNALADFTNSTIGDGSVDASNFDDFGDTIAEAIARVVEYMDEEGDGSEPVDD